MGGTGAAIGEGPCGFGVPVGSSPLTKRTALASSRSAPSAPDFASPLFHPSLAVVHRGGGYPSIRALVWAHEKAQPTRPWIALYAAVPQRIGESVRWCLGLGKHQRTKLGPVYSDGFQSQENPGFLRGFPPYVSPVLALAGALTHRRGHYIPALAGVNYRRRTPFW